MKIALFGATGNIGQCIALEALHRGHTVTAVVRDLTRLTITHERLSAVIGNVLDAQSIAQTVAGHDAVISAYGPGTGTEASTIVQAAAALVAGLHQTEVRRLIVVGGAGSLEVAPGLQLVDTPGFPDAYKAVALAHRDALKVLQEQGSALEWTSVSPAALIHPGERRGMFRIGKDHLLTDANGNSSISFADYAIALIDELETPRHIRQRFTVAY